MSKEVTEVNALEAEVELFRQAVVQLGHPSVSQAEAARALYKARIVQKAKPLCDNSSGTHCVACREIGLSHCSDPVNCGCMRPMEHYVGCGHAADGRHDPDNKRKEARRVVLFDQDGGALYLRNVQPNEPGAMPTYGVVVNGGWIFRADATHQWISGSKDETRKPILPYVIVEVPLDVVNQPRGEVPANAHWEGWDAFGRVIEWARPKPTAAASCRD